MHYQIRPFTWDESELTALVAMGNRSLLADGEKPALTVDYLYQRYAAFSHTPQISHAAWDDAGQPIALNMTLFSSKSGKGLASLYIHPDWRKTPLPLALIQASEMATLRFAEEHCPLEKPIYLLRSVPAHLSEQRALLEQLAYQLERHFYEMQIDLTTALVMPVLPDGFHIQAFDAETQASALHAAYDVAFRDAWGQREGVEYDSWRRSFMTDITDYRLWHCLWQRDKVVAFTINYLDNVDTERGKIRSIGVIPDYRRRGLASLLLHYSFKQFYEMGLKRAMLNVDSDGDTQPLKVYQQVGMSVHQENLIYRHILRGNAADIHD